MVTAAVIVEATPDVQMGVASLIIGDEYWFSYLDNQVEDNEIDQSTRDEWEAKYDGYQMEWEFTNPVVSQGDQNIDAACIHGYDATLHEDLMDYAGGGFCCGIKYVGSFSSQPEKWAVWFSTEEKDDWTNAFGFSLSHDDTDNWRDEEDSPTYSTNWKVYRWLPKE